MNSINERFEKDIDSLRQTELKIQNQVQSVQTNINFFIRLAWWCISIGALVAFIGIFFANKNFQAYGDFVGGSVASLWSLAGLFFIYVAFLGQKQQLLIQRLEIKYNRLEVKANRMELAAQKEQMIQQNNTLKQQRFENTFFQLMSLHSSIVDTIDLRGEDGIVTTSGRDCFKVFYNRIEHDIKKYSKSGKTGKASLDETIKSYLSFYKNNKADLGHYYRSLYHIMRFIDESEIENKYRYIRFVRAQHSSYELVLIFYNCLSKFGKEKFKPLIEKYCLLKNMQQDLIFNKEHISGYNSSAFKALTI